MSIANLQKVHIAEIHTENWKSQCKSDGCLTYYTGPADNESILRYILKTQCLVKGNPRYGCWVGDAKPWETFDEGCHARAIGLLISMYQEFPALRGITETINGSLRGLGGAILEAMNALLAHQFWMRGGQPFPGKLGFEGIPGFWPEAPGWKAGEAWQPDIAGLRTLNDNVLHQNVEAIILWIHIFGDTKGQYLNRCVMASEGAWKLQEINDGWAPEQCHPHGEPAWARAHEPPSWSPRATAYCMLTHMMLHGLTEEKKYLDRAVQTMNLLLPMAQSAKREFEHFLEPKTLCPIWGRKDHPFEITRNRSDAVWPSATYGQLDVMTNQMIERLEYYLTLDGVK